MKKPILTSLAYLLLITGLSLLGCEEPSPDIFYTIKFNSNGGTDVQDETLKKGEKVSEPTAPTRDNYIFEGWFSDEELKIRFDFRTLITKNTTLYAKWKGLMPATHDAPTVRGTPTKTSIDLSIPAFSDYGLTAQGEAATAAGRTLQYAVVTDGSAGAYTDVAVDGTGVNASALSEGDAETVTVSGLTPDTGYQFRVVAKNTNSTGNTTEGTASATITTASLATAPAAHDAPTVSGEPTAASIDLAIPAFSDYGLNAQGEAAAAAGRTLQYAIVTDGSAGMYADVAVDGTGVNASALSEGDAETVTVSGLTPYTDYQFRVVAQNANPTGNTTEGTASATIATASAAGAPTAHDAPAVSGEPTATSIDLAIPEFSAYGMNDQGETASPAGRTLQYAIVTDGSAGAYTEVAVGGSGVSIANALSEGDAETVTVSGLTSGTAYQFRVVAQNTNPTGNTTEGTASATIATASAAGAPAAHDAPTVSGEPTATSIDLAIPAFSNYGLNDQGEAATAAGRTLQYAVVTDGSAGAYTDVAVGGSGVSIANALSDGSEEVVTVNGLSAVTAYQFRVVAQNTNPTGNTTEGTASATIATASAASAPAAHDAPAVSGEPTATSIALAIPAFSNYGLNDQGEAATAVGRTLQYAIVTDGSAGAYTEVAVGGSGVSIANALSDGSEEVVTVNGLSAVTAYQFRVVAQNTNPTGNTTEGTASATITTASAATAPAAHDAPAVSGDPTATSIDLAIPEFSAYGMNDQGEAASPVGRTLQYAIVTDGSAGAYTDVAVGGTGVSIANALSEGDAETVTVSGLTPGTNYQFRVVAQNTNPTGNTTEGTASATIATASAAGAPAAHDAPAVSGEPGATSIDLSIPAFSDYGLNAQGEAATAAGRTLQYAVVTDGSAGAYTDVAVGGSGVSIANALSDGTDGAPEVVTVNGLSAVTAYQFRVVAQNTNPTGNTTSGTASATIATASAATAPAAHNAPTVSGTPTTTSINLSIPAFSDYGLNDQGEAATAAGRTLQYAIVTDGSAGAHTDVAVGGSGVSIANALSNTGAETVTVSGLTPGTNYQFRVVAQNTNPTGNTTSGTASATIATASAASAPTAHDAPAVSDTPTTTSIALAIPEFSAYGMNDQGEAATAVGRTLQYAIVTDGSAGAHTDVAVGGSGVSIANALSNTGAETVTVSGLTPGTNYQFRVVAQNTNPTGNTTSGTASATIATASAASAPTAHDAPAVSDTPTTTSIALAIPEFSAYGMNDQGEAATAAGRTLQYAIVTDGSAGAHTDVAVGGSGVSIANALSNTDAETVTVSGLTPGTNYQFRVVAQNTNPTGNTTEGTASATIATASAATAPAAHNAPTVSGTPTTTSINLSIPAFSDYGLNDQGEAATTAGRTLQYAVVTDGSAGAYTEVAVGGSGVSIANALADGVDGAAEVVTVNGLSAVTAYQFRVVAQNTNPTGNTTEGTASATITTASP